MEPIKIDPKFGCFLRWPEDGDEWVHPEDRAAVRELLPSPRVWRREEQGAPYRTFHYGEIRFRARPALWYELAPPEFHVGDWVEVRSQGMKHTPRVAVVREVEWDETAREIRYQLADNGVPLPETYVAEDFQPAAPTLPLDSRGEPGRRRPGDA